MNAYLFPVSRLFTYSRLCWKFSTVFDFSIVCTASGKATPSTLKFNKCFVSVSKNNRIKYFKDCVDFRVVYIPEQGHGGYFIGYIDVLVYVEFMLCSFGYWIF